MPRNPVNGQYTTYAGTGGVNGQPILSSPYNVNVHDVELDLNTARPIVAGGTGASDAATALANLGGVPVAGGVMTGALQVPYLGVNNAPISTIPLVVLARTPGEFTSIMRGDATVGSSFGLAIQAGSNASDVAFAVSDKTNTVGLFEVRGDGAIFMPGGIASSLHVGDLAIGAASPITPSIVFKGDSRTQGNGLSPYDTYITLPTYNGQAFTKINTGVGGQQVANMQDTCATDVNPYFHYHSDMNIVVLWGGVNDNGPGARTAAQIYGFLSAYSRHLQSLGWRVIICTETSAAGYDLVKNEINGHIRAEWPQFAGAIADLAADPNLGADGASGNTAYFVDGVHPTNLGYQAVAVIVQAAINTLVATVENTYLSKTVIGAKAVDPGTDNNVLVLRNNQTANITDYRVGILFSPTTHGTPLGSYGRTIMALSDNASGQANLIFGGYSGSPASHSEHARIAENGAVSIGPATGGSSMGLGSLNVSGTIQAGSGQAIGAGSDNNVLVLRNNQTGAAGGYRVGLLFSATTYGAPVGNYGRAIMAVSDTSSGQHDLIFGGYSNSTTLHEHARIPEAGGFSIGPTPATPGPGNLAVAGTITTGGNIFVGPSSALSCQSGTLLVLGQTQTLVRSVSGTIYLGDDQATPVSIGLGGGHTSIGYTMSVANLLTLAGGVKHTPGISPTLSDGVMWLASNTNTGLKIQIGGVTKTITVT